MTRTLSLAILLSIISLVTGAAEVPSLINYQGKIAVEGVDFNGTGQFKFALVNGGDSLSQTATATVTLVNGFVVGATLTYGGSGYTTAPAVTVNGAGSGAQLTTTIDGGAVTSIQVTNPGSGYQEGSTSISVAPPADLVITSYWSNDGSSIRGSQPTLPVSLPVSGGAYSVLLGDSQIPNMVNIPAETFKNDDVRLRVWFSDGANGYQLMTPDQRISAVGYAMMAANVPDGSITNSQLASGAVTASKIAADSISSEKISAGAVTADKLADGAVAADKLADGAVTSASARDGNVLLSAGKRADLENEGFVMIGVLNHTTIRAEIGETTSSEGGDTGVLGGPAVWTGTEMIVWGGQESSQVASNTGGRYNPTTDMWAAMSTTGAPTARYGHSTVWTGTEMIVWGGPGSLGPPQVHRNTGGRYNPTTDMWAAMSTTGAPTARYGHSAVWTGTEMIVWGGEAWGIGAFRTGWRYNPTTDMWVAMSTTGAPIGFQNLSTFWTGTEMIVWGWQQPKTGWRYNPTTDMWAAMSTTGAPTARYGHSTVWTGTEMIVWGGQTTKSGWRYNPTTDMWTAMSATGAPTARYGHSAVWTGTEMIVWGGQESSQVALNTGGRYNPENDVWDALTPAFMELRSTNFARQPYASEIWPIKTRSGHDAIWTGSNMILYRGGHYEIESITPGQSYLYSKP